MTEHEQDQSLPQYIDLPEAPADDTGETWGDKLPELTEFQEYIDVERKLRSISGKQGNV